MRVRFLTGASWLCCCLFALWLYWPGLSGPAILDDTQNLGVLSDLAEHPEYAWDKITSNYSGVFGRSVSMVTFVAEKIWLDEGVWGVKRTNLFIHLICGTLVFLLLRQWLWATDWPYQRSLVLLGAALWLLSPLFVSTVLYQVQRMAQLAALFSLAVLICYGYWRSNYVTGKRYWLWAILGSVFFVLGVLSKENAVLVLPLILVVEYYWYDYKGKDIYRAAKLRYWHKVGFFALVFGSLFVLVFAPDTLLSGYTHRDFNAVERVLTQTRILWHYIAQLVWPDVSVLGVFHDDFVISRHWYEPLSTLFSLLAWCFILAGIVATHWFTRWRKLAFGAAFYLVAHSMESSIIGLELYFEHRNYFPAVGLIVVLLTVLGCGFQRFPQIAPPSFAIAVLWLLFLVAKLSSQVQVWSHKDLLTMTTLNGHPLSMRANVEHANALAKRGFLDEALFYSRRADDIGRYNEFGEKALREMVLYCIANREYPLEQLKQFTIEYDASRPARNNQIFQVLVGRIDRGYCPNFPSEDFADRLFVVLSDFEHGARGVNKLLLLAAQLDNALSNYSRALGYTGRVLASNPDDLIALLMHLHFATAVQDHEQIALAKERLFALKAENKLDKHALYTLSLYTQGNEADTKTDTP